MPKVSPNRLSFSYEEPCVEYWDTNRALRKLAVKHQPLVKDVEGRAVIQPSLSNVRANYHLLKGYTQAMAENGVILTNRTSYLGVPIKKFYEIQVELDSSTPEAKAIITGTATVIRQMLTLVKRKWTRWELPRVAGIQNVFSMFRAFVCIFLFCRCSKFSMNMPSQSRTGWCVIWSLTSQVLTARHMKILS